MYEQFLNALLNYIRALNQACKETDETDGLAPYVQWVPVIMENDVCGFLIDEIGGSYQYHEVTPEEREWWKQRPKSMGNR
jgi:hypothetical protein